MTEPIKRNHLRWWKPVAATAAILILIVWSTGALNEKVQPGTVMHLPGIPLPTGTETLTIHKEPVPSQISIAGTVTSEEKIHVSARVGGVVEVVTVSAGNRVERGQPLLKIDDREMREQRAAAEAQLRRAESEFQRARQLHAAQATTDQVLTDAESSFHTAQARLDQIQIALSYHDIRAPISGIVTDRRIELGDLAAHGQVLLALYNPTTMRLDVPVPVRLVDRLNIGDPARVWLDRQLTMVDGTVTEIVSEIDARSRTQMVRVRLNTGEMDVLPGTFGRLWIDLEPHPGYRIPESAVYRLGQLELVQVALEGRILRRLVRTGPASEGRVEILSGLADGDVILVNPVQDI